MRTIAALVLVVLSACTGAVCEPSIGETDGCPVEETDSDTVTNPDSDSDVNVETDTVDSDTPSTDDTVDSTDTADSDTVDTDRESDTDLVVETDETDLTETDMVDSDVADSDAAQVDTAHPCVPAVGWTAACPDTADTYVSDSDTQVAIDTDTVVVETDETDETVDSDSVTPVDTDVVETDVTETDTVDTLPQDTDSEVEPHETGDTFETGDTATETDTVETDSADTDAVIDPLTVDDDLDGYSEVDGDCEDANPTMYPEERTEWFDWADNDCDGTADEDCDTSCGYDYASQVPGLGYCRDDVYQFWLTQSLEFECVGHVTYVHLDLDGDGYLSDVDCKDWIDSIHPGAYDYGSDGVDQDCDGLDLDSGRFTDDDGDGYCESTTCTDGSLPGDCADWIDSIHPDARDWGGDGTDQDCDGQDVDSTWLADDDLDGYTELEGDCDDGDIDTYPGAPERFDWADNDCDSHLVGADYGIDETCNVGCGWDYVSFHPGQGYCRDDVYAYWLTELRPEDQRDYTWECTATTWFVADPPPARQP